MIFQQWQRYFLLAIAVGISSSSGFAGNSIDNDENQAWSSQALTIMKSSWVATVSLGPVWENAGQTQTYYLAPNVEKTYVANNHYHALVDGEIFLGIQRPLRNNLSGQLGVAVAATSNAPMSGNIWDDADPRFDNYIYSYNIQHTHVAIKGKLLANRDYMLIPWISGSLGIGFNQAYDFSDTPTISQAITIPSFANNTVTAFTYTVGAGIQHNLSEHWQLGLGYEFADWGRSHLGQAPGQTVNTGLALSHLFTNGFLFNLSYYA